MPRQKGVPIPGSERKPLPGATAVAPADPNQLAQVTVRLRRRKGAQTVLKRALDLSLQLPKERTYLTREQFIAQAGADPADLARVEAFARNHNLTVVDANLASRTVRLAGTVGDLSAAFGVRLNIFQAGEVKYRGRTTPVYLPSELAGIVQGVSGLDNRPVARPHYRRLAAPAVQSRDRKGAGKGAAIRAAAPASSFKVTDLGRLYNFPANLNGSGQCIALIELNDVDDAGRVTGTGFALSDLNTFFQGLGLRVPKLVSVGVDGGANLPGRDPDADGEVTLDIEVAGALAPGAHIAVYFAPNTTAGFIDAISTAVHDSVRNPSVISISWGGPEDTAGRQLLDGIEQVLQDAAALGVTVCCASGDNGSADEPPDAWDKKPHADFPASSDYALGCGGTKLIAASNTISSEVVWNEGWQGGASGGGVSNYFTKPPYQSKVSVPKSPSGKIGRGVPDVAGNADPNTGYQVFVGGQAAVFGGTSAVAPLWAALIALINQSLRRKGASSVGFLNPLLYTRLAGSLNDITQGNNDIDGSLKGSYSAGPGWDPCTGLGSPDGTKLLKALAS